MTGDMAMTFSDRLRTAQRAQRSLLCIGLDTDISKLPTSVMASADPVVEFNRRIIEATHDLVCAYKINLAFYEARGEHGWQSVRRTLEAIPEGIITIGDAKRGDIGNSSGLYAKSLRDDFGFDASTVNPYMGSDSVLPFLSRPEHGAFILAVTSNPGARDFQYLKVRGKPLYEHVIARVHRWNGSRNCGLVVGATRPAALKRIRFLAPDLPLLIPGVGSQGGDLRASVRYGCDRHGELAVINASRSVLYASHGVDFARVAREQALALHDAIQSFRDRYFRA